MATQATITEFSRSVDPAVNVVFDGAFKQVPTTYADVASVSRTDIYTTEISSNVGSSMASVFEEQDSLIYEAYKQGNGKNLTQFPVAIGVQITKLLWKFQRLNQIKALVAQSGNAIARRREFDVTKLLERGFLTTYTHAKDGSTKISLTGGDAVALFSASHATVRSSTAQVNRITDGTTVNMDIAEDALEAAETVTAPAITDDSDQVIGLNYDTLLVGRKKVWVAQRLLKSTGRVGTPNNDYNLLQGRYKLVTLHFMDTAYADYYFLKDTTINNGDGFVSYLESQGMAKDGPYVDFDTKSIKYSWDMIYTLGHNMWQSYLGSKGTNSA